ncbi:MAG: CPBP family intramembrane metalloprotease [Oscillospiraceae bacterium]|nr:CPBP family intramembrane metalloprotease [Oscillospiraceae bacterium]
MKKEFLKDRLNIIGLGLIIFVVIRYFVPGIGRLMGLEKNLMAWVILCAITLVFSCMVPTAVIEKMCDVHPKINLRKPDLKDRVIRGRGLLVIEGAVLINRIVLKLLSGVGVAFPPQRALRTYGVVELFIYFIYMTVLPAFFEEILVRGIILNILREHGERFAIIVSAFIFMMMHNSIQSFIPIFVSGVILGCIYRYTGSITTSMLLHFINNTYSFLILYMNTNAGVSAIGFAAFMLILLVVLGSLCIWLLYKSENDIMSPLKNRERQERDNIFSAPIFTMAFLCMALTVASQLYRDIIVR